MIKFGVCLKSVANIRKLIESYGIFARIFVPFRYARKFFDLKVQSVALQSPVRKFSN